MRDKNLDLDTDKFTGFFDKDTEIKGDLIFQGSFKIDGQFKGKINSESTLIIGEQGKVDADIKIGNIIVSGEVKGNIQAMEKVEIKSLGRVFGAIISPKLIIEEGAYLEATCHTASKPPETEIKEKKNKREAKT
jgi:cytoskeletal protein CcmA (bactofilin family)